MNDILITADIGSNVLAHYGVKGMHWGVRRYQPYPKGHKGGKEVGEAAKKGRLATEKEISDAMEELKIDNDTNNRHHKIDRSVSDYVKKSMAKTTVKALLTSVSALGETGNPLAMPIAFGVTELIGTTFMGARLIKHKLALNRYDKNIAEIKSNKKVDKETGLKLKRTKSTPDEDMKKINPAFGALSDESKANCVACSHTYALRRKGYDVMANGASEGYVTGTTLTAYPNAKHERFSANGLNSSKGITRLVKEINLPNNAYGELCMNWIFGGGHSVIYTVENNTPMIRDCQSGKVYKGKAMKKLLEHATGQIEFTRLDNTKPNINALKEYGLINPAGQAFDKKEIKHMSEDGPYLAHHGIKGMHWGVRRYQPYPKGHKGGKEVGAAAKASMTRAERKKTIGRLKEYAEYGVAYNRTKYAAKLWNKRDVAGDPRSLKSRLANKIDKPSGYSDRALNRAFGKVYNPDIQDSLWTLYDTSFDKIKSGKAAGFYKKYMKELSSYANSSDKKIAKSATSAIKMVDKWDKHPKLYDILERSGKATKSVAKKTLKAGAITFAVLGTAGVYSQAIKNEKRKKESSGYSTSDFSNDSDDFIDVTWRDVKHMSEDGPYLAHYGVKGMHWGVRRYQPYPKGHKGGKEVGEAAKSSTPSAERKTDTSPNKVQRSISVNDAKNVSKNIDQYTDAEIEALIRKLNQRQRINQSLKNPSKENKQPGAAVQTVLKITKGVTSLIRDGLAIADVFGLL